MNGYTQSPIVFGEIYSFMIHVPCLFVKRLFLLCFCFVLIACAANAQTIDLRFNNNFDCDNQQYLVTVQMRVAEAGQTANIGSSSIFMLYNSAALQFDSYESINFDGESLCLAGLFPAWDTHGVDGSSDGIFNITLNLDATLDETQTEFSCPTITDQWEDVGTITFNIQDSGLTSNLSFSTNPNFISFNNVFPNDGSNQFAEGTFDSSTELLSCGAAQVAPTSSFIATTGVNPLEAEFDASASTDSDGTIVSYSWDFGDGNTGTGLNPTHTYANGGTYTVTLTVTDNDGQTHTSTSMVTVDAPLEAPTADFTVTPTTGTAPLLVNVSATSSFDADGLLVGYDWDFGDGNTASGVTASNTYTQSGSYTIGLTVTDDDGLTDYTTYSSIVVEAVQESPTAIIDATPTSGTAPLNVAFSGSSSTDSDGSIVAYDWNFGDGSTATGANVNHTYNTPGLYTAVLTVTDNDGLTDNATFSINVDAALEAPTADFTATPTSGESPLSVNFSASNSSDNDGNIVSYDWDFGDGNTGSGLTTSHTYTTGTYTATLTVTDNDGLTDVSTITISVDEPAPILEAPTASFTFTPDGGEAPSLVSFNASSSSDTDGNIISYNWDFGDGATGNGLTSAHAYVAAGSYTVVLTVTDDSGLTDEITQVVEVVEPTPLENPVANFTASPISGVAPLTTNFSASNSSDSDGTIVSYVWDFGDNLMATGVTTSHLFMNPGVYDVLLIVTDNDGLSDTHTQQITVEEPAPIDELPIAVIDYTVDFDNGEYDITLDGTNSSDPDGGPMDYEWFMDGIFIDDASITTWTNTTEGTYELELSITDDEGNSVSAFETLTLSCEPINETASNTASINACSGSFIDLVDAFGLSGQSSVVWTDENQSNLADAQNVFVTNDACQTIDIQYYAAYTEYDANTCTYTAYTNTYTITVYPEITGTATAIDECSVELSTCSNFTVSWSDGQQIVQSNLYTAEAGQAGTVTFTISNPNGLAGCDSEQIQADFDCPAAVVGCQNTAEMCIELGESEALCPEFCDLDTDQQYFIVAANTDFHSSISLLDGNCLNYTPLYGDAQSTALEVVACQSGANGIVCDTFTYQIQIGCGTTVEPPVTNNCELSDTVCTQPFTPVDICVEFCEADRFLISAESYFDCGLHQVDNNCFVYYPLPGINEGSDVITVVGCNFYQVCDTIEVVVNITETCPDGGRLANQPSELECRATLPNVFTPNKDGVNDYWSAQTLFDCYPSESYSLHIYNSYGQVVHQTESNETIDNLLWNGEYYGNGETVKPGTYFYVLQLIQESGLTKRSGYIEVRH